jgi:hypothetical protein
MYFTLANIHIPINQEVVTANNTDILVVVRKEANILIPLSNFFFPKYTMINVDIYFNDLNLRRNNFIAAPLLTSNSSSLLSQPDSKFQENIFFTKYNLTMRVGHPLYVANSTSKYNLEIIYRPGSIQDLTNAGNAGNAGNADRQVRSNMLGNATTTSELFPRTLEGSPSNIKVLSIPLQYQITSLDFSRPEYFWIIALGVLASRVFTISKVSLNEVSINLGVGELIWIPFSAIITLLIFSSFVNQITLSNDVILNLSLAFAFGFGFDKVFESWQKSPTNTRTRNES